jgi:hypothetical protein
MRGLMRLAFATAILTCLVSAAHAQRGEVTLNLNEQFFNAFIDSVFANFEPPEFPIASVEKPGLGAYQAIAFGPGIQTPCPQTVKILRETGGVRTSVRIGNGHISVPLAFSGTYSPPFVGCVEFAGWADTNIDLQFDRDTQRLVGKATVNTVNLNGAGGLGSAVIAKMIQGSLDRKMNPIEILRLEKLSFGVPLQNTGNLRMKAVAVTPEIGPGSVTLRIQYEFLKG